MGLEITDEGGEEISIEEAARELGVSKRTIMRYVSSGKLTSTRRGYVDRGEVQIEAGREQGVSDMAALVRTIEVQGSQIASLIKLNIETMNAARENNKVVTDALREEHARLAQMNADNDSIKVELFGLAGELLMAQGDAEARAEKERQRGEMAKQGLAYLIEHFRDRKKTETSEGSVAAERVAIEPEETDASFGRSLRQIVAGLGEGEREILGSFLSSREGGEGLMALLKTEE
ncbi:MAG: helix-turn-helix domain-containing protein [Pyrinomonadaceae bacterium]|nr:helix-turn-helix domain-containing protein [Pyrinomonadaceae bacterium]